MSNPKYRVEPAKTGRSTCKASREKIEVGELRFGTFADMMGHPTYQWRKLSYIGVRIARNVEAKVGSIENVDGYNDLNDKQKHEFMSAMAFAKSGKTKGVSKACTKGKASLKCKGDALIHNDPQLGRGVSEGPAQVLPLLTWLGVPETAAQSYKKLLEDQGFDSKAAFLTLTKADLDQLGVLTGHSRLIIRYISSWKEQLAIEPSSASGPTTNIHASSFARRNAAARRWKRRQDLHPSSTELASKFHRSRSTCLAEETGMSLEEVRSLLRENDEAVSAGGSDGAR